MALQLYKNHQSPGSRSRSSSYSSPIRNRIVYQEIYAVGSNTLVRSYSCDQVFNKDERGQTFQTTKIQVSSFVTPEKKCCETQKREVKTEPKRLEFAPPKPVDSMAKKRKRLITNETSNTGKLKYIFLPVLTSFLCYYYMVHRECSHVWDLELTTNQLKDSVFGQDEAVTKINSVLKMCNDSNDIFTMVFTGGVGVGKTYSSSIISHNFPWNSNTQIIFPESLHKAVENLKQTKLSTCGCNLVTIDDLTVKNVNETINLVMELYNKRRNNEKLLVIVIFQVRSETERNEIVKTFSNFYINYYHVPFKKLTKDVVEKCYIRELEKHSINIPISELDKLVNEKMKDVNVVKGPVGCKGIPEEVSSYYKKNSN